MATTRWSVAETDRQTNRREREGQKGGRGAVVGGLDRWQPTKYVITNHLI